MQSLNKSDKILIPFIDGKSVMDSQMKPRMYKTRSAFEKSFPGYGRHEEDIDLVEYTPVVHGEWKYERYTGMWPAGVKKQDYVCTACDNRSVDTYRFCPNCGAMMLEESE